MNTASPLAITATTSDFATLRRQGGCYVDKSHLLSDLIGPRNRASHAMLLMRPRAFGKTLALTMLKSFIELNYEHPGQPNAYAELFADLRISQDQDTCAACQSQHPVVYISFRDIIQDSFAAAREALYQMMAGVAAQFAFLADEPRLSKWSRERLLRLLQLADPDMPEKQRDITLWESLLLLAHCLHEIYQRRVIFLIDDYDTPLFRAASYSTPQDHSSYSHMYHIIVGILIQVVKTNDRAVDKSMLSSCRYTCMAHMFSGINNLTIEGMQTNYLAELTGFTEDEVRKLLAAHGLEEHLDEARSWYGGYRCGQISLYNPASLIHYCLNLQTHPQEPPRSFRSESVYEDFLPLRFDKLSAWSIKFLQKLLDGQPQQIYISGMPLDCTDLEQDGLFTSSFPYMLCASGQLAWQQYAPNDDIGRPSESIYRIPNREIVDHLCRQFYAYFGQGACSGDGHPAQFIAALFGGDAESVQHEIEWLREHFLIMPQPDTWPQVRPRRAAAVQQASTPFSCEPRHGLDYPHLVQAVLQCCADLAVRDLSLAELSAPGQIVLSCSDAQHPQQACVLLFAERSAASLNTATGHAFADIAQYALTLAANPERSAALFAQYPQLEQLRCYGVGWEGRECLVKVQLIQRPAADA